MSFGDVKIGRVTLREALVPSQEQQTNDGSATLSLSGQEATPPLDQSDMAAVQDDIRSLSGGLLVPVQFRDKTALDGFYQATGSSVSLMSWTGDVVTADWQVGLTRIGSDSEVDIESRLAGPGTRTNDFAVTGERWHAPPIGHTAYLTSGAPSTMTRDSGDGTITVYRGVPSGSNPRFSCPVGSYLAGRVRVLDVQGRERTGVRWAMPRFGWQLTNGLVKVDSGASLSVGSWAGGAWAEKSWDLMVNGGVLAQPDATTTIRNDLECCTVRSLWSLAAGRVTCDFTIRRGSRFVELWVQTSTSATIKLVRGGAEAGFSGTGYVRATSDDADANRYIVGSSKTFTPDLSSGGISKAAATSMDAFIGVERGGTAAVSGDGASAVYQQFLSSPAETVRASRR